jgi:hypothetical protein
MAKKNLLGNIIGQGANQGKTNSDEVNNGLGKGSNPPGENNGGGETPSGPIGKEPPTEKDLINQTPKIQEPSKEKPIIQETLVLSNPGNNEGAEYKAGSGSIRIAPDDMTYIDLLVKHKRMSGYTNYTKKEALGEALGLLMDKYPKEKLLSSSQR